MHWLKMAAVCLSSSLENVEAAVQTAAAVPTDLEQIDFLFVL